jgi:hypothetical protein
VLWQPSVRQLGAAIAGIQGRDAGYLGASFSQSYAGKPVGSVQEAHGLPGKDGRVVGEGECDVDRVGCPADWVVCRRCQVEHLLIAVEDLLLLLLLLLLLGPLLPWLLGRVRRACRCKEGLQPLLQGASIMGMSRENSWGGVDAKQQDEQRCAQRQSIAHEARTK